MNLRSEFPRCVNTPVGSARPPSSFIKLNTMAETEEERRQRIRLKQDLLITIQKRRDEINDAARRLGWLAASFNIEVKASPIDFKEVEEAFKVGYSDRVKKDIKDSNGRLH